MLVDGLRRLGLTGSDRSNRLARSIEAERARGPNIGVHFKLRNVFTLDRKTTGVLIWSRDGQFLAINGSSLLRYNSGSFWIVHEGEVLAEVGG